MAVFQCIRCLDPVCSIRATNKLQSCNVKVTDYENEEEGNFLLRNVASHHSSERRGQVRSQPPPTPLAWLLVMGHACWAPDYADLVAITGSCAGPTVHSGMSTT